MNERVFPHVCPYLSDSNLGVCDAGYPLTSELQPVAVLGENLHQPFNQRGGLTRSSSRDHQETLRCCRVQAAVKLTVCPGILLLNAAAHPAGSAGSAGATAPAAVVAVVSIVSGNAVGRSKLTMLSSHCKPSLI